MNRIARFINFQTVIIVAVVIAISGVLVFLAFSLGDKANAQCEAAGGEMQAKYKGKHNRFQCVAPDGSEIVIDLRG